MSKCDECDVGIQAVPYRCRHCDKVLCPDHRLMELHDCAAAPKVRYSTK